jgi:hypothetical protein
MSAMGRTLSERRSCAVATAHEQEHGGHHANGDTLEHVAEHDHQRHQQHHAEIGQQHAVLRRVDGAPLRHHLVRQPARAVVDHARGHVHQDRRRHRVGHVIEPTAQEHHCQRQRKGVDQGRQRAACPRCQIDGDPRWGGYRHGCAHNTADHVDQTLPAQLAVTLEPLVADFLDQRQA